MKKSMEKDLDLFFATKTASDIDRTTFLVCNLHDTENMLTISLVFIKDWHSLVADEYGLVTIDGKGAIFTLPSFWLSIPKELAMPFFTKLIDNYYSGDYDDDNMNTGTGSGNGNTSSSIGNNIMMPGNNNCPYV
jgi:hypothetical protein